MTNMLEQTTESRGYESGFFEGDVSAEGFDSFFISVFAAVAGGFSFGFSPEVPFL